MTRACGTFFLLVVLTAMGMNLSGCAEVQKKIVRVRKKPPPRPRFNVEPVRLSNRNYYAQRYLYWKSWQSELVKDLGGNRKKQLQDVYEARRHLAALPNYLGESQSRALASYLKVFDDLTKPLLEKRLSVTDNARMRRKLEALRLRIEKQFSPRDMNPFLKPDLPPIDLSLYADEEDLPLPSSVLGENAAAR